MADLTRDEVIEELRIMRHNESLYVGKVHQRRVEAYDAALALLQHEGWQPMETAPKDGTIVVAAAHVEGRAEAEREIARLKEQITNLLTDFEGQPDRRWRLRGITPCPVCRWPLQVDIDHHICECCGIEHSYDRVEAWEWDGKWWQADDRFPPPQIIINLTKRAESAEAALARLRARIEGLIGHWRLSANPSDWQRADELAALIGSATPETEQT